MNQLIKQNNELNSETANIIEQVVLKGDLSGLTSDQKVKYYHEFCKSLNLNPLTQPFQIINFQGKQILYATKDCTEQLRKNNEVSIVESTTKQEGDLYIVSVKAQDSTGRTDVATGAVLLTGLLGDKLANAVMKAETKAKRRVTLSICGLGILDESETDTLGSYTTHTVNQEGNVVDKESGLAIDESKRPAPRAKGVVYDKECSECDNKVTAGIAGWSTDKFGKILCYNCQKQAKAIPNDQDSETMLNYEAGERTHGDEDNHE